MSSRIEEIKARWAAATPGPCHRNEDLVYTLENGRNRVWWHVLAVGMELRDERISTAHAIANAPEDTRWLVERVERLERALESLDCPTCNGERIAGNPKVCGDCDSTGLHPVAIKALESEAAR